MVKRGAAVLIAWVVLVHAIAVMSWALAPGESVSVAPDHADALAADTAPIAARHGTIFLQFDGAELRKTEAFEDDDARTDTSWLFGGSFEPYADDRSRDAIVQAVREDWARYDVDIVTGRPSSGAYVMAVVTPTNPVGGGVVGYAPVDCRDATTHSNIIFAFHDRDDRFSTSARATTVSQEVAHSFGLEHTDAPQDVMNPVVGTTVDPRFTDACAPVTGTSFCGPQHEAQCGSPTQQSSHAELLALFGPAQPDTQPPTGAVVEPRDGSMVAMGSEVAVVVEATDDTAVDEVILYDGGVRVGARSQAPYHWRLADPHAGTHELYALIVDDAGHESLTEVALVGVGEPPAADQSADLPGFPGGPPLSRGDDDAAGCRIGAPHSTPPWASFAWIAVIAALRRPRRRASRAVS